MEIDEKWEVARDILTWLSILSGVGVRHRSWRKGGINRVEISPLVKCYKLLEALLGQGRAQPGGSKSLT